VKKLKSYPYIRTSQKTFERERDLLNSGHPVQYVYDTILKESGGPLRSNSQSSEPRDKRQLYNQNSKRKRCTENNQNDDDDLTDLIRRLKSIDVIGSIVVQQDRYFYFIATAKQTNDVAKFCCSDSNVSVLGIDTTYNLCDMWVTDSCYRNKRLISKRSEAHPVYLGPTLLYFTKDTQTFTRFSLDMQAANPETRNIKKIGIDMEDAIYNGVKALFPDSQRLYCVRHLKQRDEVQIDKLMEKMKCSEREKIAAKNEILLDIYGQRRGTSYEYGSAVAKQKLDLVESVLPRRKPDRPKHF